MRVAVYARVSTNDKGQDPENQLAKVEAQKISERTKAGMARAKAKGIKLGRPKIGIDIRQQIAKRAAAGQTPYAIAKALGIDRHTAVKYAVV
jgi:DNA invertase Pin-like site-specific DNA recombinase